jgi:alanyl-tRNA synthetase
MKEFEKGTDPFVLFTTYGFPIELTEELAREKGKTIDLDAFKKDMERHQELSRAGGEQRFKGGLADTSEKTTMLHTATHLMLAGLRKYLGDHVHQAGSNITEERTRFDFTHPEKISREVLDKVEAYVNEAIQKKSAVVIEEMPKEKAKELGVEGSFWEKYPDVVNVYTVRAEDGTVYSRELCGGPHVENTGSMRGTFKIVKEEASSAGVRRVKAVLE